MVTDAPIGTPPVRGRVIWQIPDGYDAGKERFRVIGYRPQGVVVDLYTLNEWKGLTNTERKKAREALVWEMSGISMRNGDMTPLCWLCGCANNVKTPKDWSRPEFAGGLFLDHDHATGVVRGLLCSCCNRILDQLMATAFWTPALQGYLDGPRVRGEWEGLVPIHKNGSAPLYCNSNGSLGPDADSWSWGSDAL